MEAQKEKILVTGGAGFIGSHLVDRLISDGYPVAVVDNLSSGSLVNVHPTVLSRRNGCSFYQIDIRDAGLARVFHIEKPSYVYHFAAQLDVRFSVEDPIHDIDINIIGGVNILKNALCERVKKIIFSSSGGAIYGELPEHMQSIPHTHPPSPASPYGYSKLIFENYLEFVHEAYGIPSVALRFSNVYGPRQGLSKESGVISILTNALFNKKPFVVYGDGNQTRDFVYADDCVDMLVRSLNTDIIGAFHVSTGRKTSVNTLINLISSHTNIPLEVRYDAEKKGDVRHNCLDYSATKELTGWEPKISIEEGVKRTLDWTYTQKTSSTNGGAALQSIGMHHWFRGSL